MRIWCGPDARRDCRIAKAEGAGGEEGFNPGLRIETWGTPILWFDQQFQRAAFHFLGFARIDEMARRQDERSRREDLRLPEMRKAQIGHGRAHGLAS